MKMNLNDVLQGKHSVALGGHVRPDGDCVGACLGLYMYLKDQYPDIEADVYLEEIPEAYGIISCTDEVKHESPEDKVYDLFICLDCGDTDRLGFSGPLFQKAKETACIDHHVSNDAFADVNYIVPDASSTSELVYTLLDREKITKPQAEALYMGIAHDTGIFQYSCTSPETMEIAADLMRKGINGNEIIDKTYYEKTYVQNQILGRALMESILILDKRCIISFVRKKEMEFFQAQPSDLEGIVSQLRQTKGVEVAMFLHEVEPRRFKVSLRSRDKVDVSRIAKYFGGGGHVRAAGVTMSGSVHDVINNITGQIVLQLDGKKDAAQ
ncbi:DHH family phosphoesterase [Lachnoclostridium sp. An169]|uniref:DHH family phosphoesterase n=1 Tax=Lachnoclostridium sp. An169 TaxID=1965569 RepID=UPI000B3AEA42|nr:DHH family phosphoesterase [Lachnoclostridium sp. An169]